MKEKKVTPFQFKKISRESLETENVTPNQPAEPTKSIIHPPVEKKSSPKNEKELLESIGDKDILTSEDKINVIDYVFKRDKSPLIICHTCGNKIGSNYFVSHTVKDDLVFCAGCVQSLPPCDNCGIPVKLSGPKLSVTYCLYCRVNRECTLCSQSITAKETHRIESVKGSFCYSCFKKSERCVNCQSPLSEIGYHNVLDKKLCSSCYSRVISLEEAVQINNKIIAMLNKAFSIDNNTMYPIKMINYKALNPPKYPEVLGRYVKLSGKRVLALYGGITKERAIGLFAYEYGKQVIQMIHQGIREDQLVEAFAFWSKNYILRELGELDEVSEIKNIMNKNPYVKRLLNIERLGGVSRLAEKLKEGEIEKR